MRKRIYRNMLLLTFISVMLVAVFFVFVFYTNFSSQVKGELKSKAVLLEALLNQSRDNKVLHLSGNEVRISIISPEGKVLYDSEFDAENLPNHSGREEIEEALQSGTGESRRYSQTLGEETYYYSKKLADGTVLRLAKTTSSISGMFMGSVHFGALIVLLILLLSHFIAKSLTKKIAKPINEIDLDTKESIYDELSPLIRTIAHQKKQIEAQLSELEAKAQTISAITENMREGILLLDENATVLSANKSAKQIFEAPLAEGKNIVEITRESRVNQHVKSALTGERSSITVNIALKDYAVFFSPVPGIGALVLLLDITEKANTEKLRREFSANVSHELKTPLTSVLGYAEMLENGMVKREDITGFAGKIKGEASRLLYLIDDIIMLSQLDETAQNKGLKKLDLSQTAKEVIASLKDRANAAGVTLESNLETSEVMSDGQMMYELLYNLIDNGIKYNKPGGSVEVTVTPENGKVKITVSDTGIGIPEEHHSRIFERFYRVDKSHSKKTGGTGLGLSIVKHIVTYHNGALKLESKEGEGTTISVVIPCS